MCVHGVSGKKKKKNFGTQPQHGCDVLSIWLKKNLKKEKERITNLHPYCDNEDHQSIEQRLQTNFSHSRIGSLISLILSLCCAIGNPQLSHCQSRQPSSLSDWRPVMAITPSDLSMLYCWLLLILSSTFVSPTFPCIVLYVFLFYFSHFCF